MGSIKERYGKNYILCDTDGKGKIRNPLQIVKSWENKVNYITEDVAKEQVGLRKAQLGAIFAIRAHWTTSTLPATVVMPTGTGKTETMITTIIAEQCNGNEGNEGQVQRNPIEKGKHPWYDIYSRNEYVPKVQHRIGGGAGGCKRHRYNKIRGTEPYFC